MLIIKIEQVEPEQYNYGFYKDTESIDLCEDEIDGGVYTGNSLIEAVEMATSHFSRLDKNTIRDLSDF